MELKIYVVTVQEGFETVGYHVTLVDNGNMINLTAKENYFNEKEYANLLVALIMKNHGRLVRVITEDFDEICYYNGALISQETYAV